jgi:hypothetical protein
MRACDKPLHVGAPIILPFHNHNDEARIDIHPRSEICDVRPVKIAIKEASQIS